MSDEIPSPRDTVEFFGHEAAETRLWNAIKGGEGHHSWIISGPRGIGKATFAYRTIRALLAGKDGPGGIGTDHPIARRIGAGSHTDLLVIEPAFDEKTNEAKREIGVDEVRQLGEFLSLTPAEGQYRIVLIDSVDELNVNAANAILKLLEEPPASSLILLLSHNPGRLLPTIRSRCAQLRMEPLNPNDYSHLMRSLAPGLSTDDITFLNIISNASPGVSLTMAEDNIIAMYASLIAIISSSGTARSRHIAELAATFQKEKAHSRFAMLGQLTQAIVSRAVHYAHAKTSWNEAMKGEEAALQTMLALQPASAWAKRFPELQQQFSVATRLHLDYKTVLISQFSELMTPLPRAA